MNYGDISNKWKQFLAENTFKEDAIINKDKKKDKKKEKKRKDGKEIIVSEEDKVSEWEEFDEWTLPSSRNEGTQSAGYNDAVDSVEEEKIEEMSAMSGGAVQGYAGNAFAPKKKIKHR